MLGEMVSKRMTKNLPQQSCTGSRRALSVDLTLPACLHQQNVHRRTPNLSTYYTRERLLLLGNERTHVIRQVADGHNHSLAVTVPFATVCRKMIFLRIGVPHNRSYDFSFREKVICSLVHASQRHLTSACPDPGIGGPANF